MESETMSVEARVRAILVEHLGLEPGRVTRTASIMDELGADSLDCVDITMAVEEEFGFEISNASAEQCKTMGDIIVLVNYSQPPASQWP